MGRAITPTHMTQSKIYILWAELSPPHRVRYI
jgi:hypothetical protein